jgi:hypothetical protein
VLPDLGTALDEANGTLAAAIMFIDDLIAERDEAAARVMELEVALASAQREIRALRWCNGARERHIVRLLAELRDLRRRLPRGERYALSPLEAFIAAHPIVEVISQTVELQPRENGHHHYLAGHCPFHEDAHPSPSLVVHPYHGQFMCYTCGAGGTVVDFLRLLRERGEAA